MSEEEKWMPTMTGNTTAFQPEYREGAYIDGKLRWTKWKSIPTADGYGVVGVAYPGFCGGLFKTIGLYGYEQAQALAWTLAAEASARGSKVETRVATYEFVYNLKARRTHDYSRDAAADEGETK